mmetsp:Transcript_27305/g.43851  ORF Transcript_27305/g.43851 Transcript_27305/m.43851 type:complete len:389 (-) Transcript_27305:170-1336(-)|eukprot:CAMPEP_0179414332 /NCGR_PEP_ID=MMETSP0799-20121207/5607_1 /TAXON_ID=46947 /ORGANISM="Geminigera cryophila, Strain CCMP2564" /LENGTH=388 /DNA_ID=CAMNT_0021186927 /DNA_START=98 /DNA_END=1264 /DNA_ORIENTATION=-
MPTNDSGIFIENALIKIPVESLSRNVKNEHKQMAKELESVTNTLAELRKKNSSAREASSEIAKLVGRLQGLKRKVQTWHQEGNDDLERTNLRIQYLRSHELGDAASVADRDGGRIDRLVADHLARHGLLHSAKQLVQETEMKELVDIQMFEHIQPLVDALLLGDLNPALKWCIANRPKLKKNKSTLEFELRLQAFVELVRSDAIEAAITYARNHLGPAAGDAHKLSALKKYMAVLAFGKDTRVQPYQFYLETQRRFDLAQRLKAEMWQVSFVAPQSQLSIALQAGLTCLKSTQCLENRDPSSKCPVCHPILSQIAVMLPYANRRNSTLVCTMTGEIMNENNAPMALPNGYVYATVPLQRMAASNLGQVECPRTGDSYDFSDVRKVFVS